MQEFEGVHNIKVRIPDVVISDSESIASESETNSFVAENDDVVVDTNLKLTQNQSFIENYIQINTGDPKQWSSRDSHYNPVNQTIIQPTASNTKTPQWLNPFLYRSMTPISSLDDLAIKLSTPDNWLERFQEISQISAVRNSLNNFCNLATATLENQIEPRFNNLVITTANALDVLIDTSSQEKIIVGGILAKSELDIRGNSDPLFIDSASKARRRYLLASEIKRATMYSKGHKWYNGTRGLQTLMALFNCNCPTILLTQEHFCLFLESEDRREIFKFPSSSQYGIDTDYRHHSTISSDTRVDLLQVLVICLLSERNKDLEIDDLLEKVTISSSTFTPVKEHKAEPLVPPSSTQQLKGKPESSRSSDRIGNQRNASYLSGYVDGVAVYTEIRVYDEDQIARIEKDIEQDFRREALARES